MMEPNEIRMTEEIIDTLFKIAGCAAVFAEHGWKAEHSLTDHERWLLERAESHANSQISILEQMLPDDFEVLDGFEWCLREEDIDKG